MNFAVYNIIKHGGHGGLLDLASLDGAHHDLLLCKKHIMTGSDASKYQQDIAAIFQLACPAHNCRAHAVARGHTMELRSRGEPDSKLIGMQLWS